MKDANQVILLQFVDYIQSIIINKSYTMSIIIRSLSASLTRSNEIIGTMDPYVKIFFGGHQYKTKICQKGGKNPVWSDIFNMSPASDPLMRIQVWDLDYIKDDVVGEGTFNLMNVYNMPNQRSENLSIDLLYKGKPAGKLSFSVEMQGLQGYWGSPQQATGWGNKVYEQSEITNQLYAGQSTQPGQFSSQIPVGTQIPVATQIPGVTQVPLGSQTLHGHSQQFGQQNVQGELYRDKRQEERRKW